MLGYIRRLHYWSILGAQVIMLFIAAVMRDHVWMRILFAATMVLVFGTVISTIWSESKIPKIIATISAIIAILFGVVGHIVMNTALSVHFSHAPGTPIDWLLFISSVFYAIFIAIAIFSIARHIFWHDHITSNVIAGSICLYMLIGMFFAFVYAAMALVVPGVFVIENTAASQVYLPDFFFFSYSTLATVGFGGIVVENQIARVIASIEAITGSLFIAIMVAGLVGTYFAQRKHPQQQQK